MTTLAEKLAAIKAGKKQPVTVTITDKESNNVSSTPTKVTTQANTVRTEVQNECGKSEEHATASNEKRTTAQDGSNDDATARLRALAAKYKSNTATKESKESSSKVSSSGTKSISERLAELKAAKDRKGSKPVSVHSNGSGSNDANDGTMRGGPRAANGQVNATARLAQIKAMLESKKEDSNDASESTTIPANAVSTGTNKSTTANSNSNSNSNSNVGATEPRTTSAPTALNVVEQLGKSDVDYQHLNEQQRKAVTMTGDKESFCLIGPAGSGKTTTVRSVATHLLETGSIERLAHGTKKVLKEGAPSIAVLSYTNQAVRNIKEALPQEFRSHCSTFHMILEYQPEFIEVDDAEGNTKNTMRFLPTYGTTDYDKSDAVDTCTKLPHLDIVVVEEAGSVPLDLWNIFISALPDPENTTFIFLGDLNQLPPVFDDAVLGFKLLDLPIVELTEIYRNVGLVTQLAHRILTGRGMADKECESWNKTDSSGTIRFMPFPKVRNWEVDLAVTGNSFKKMALAGRFNPATDVCLIPFNVKFGAVELNKYILQGITEREDKEVYHVITGLDHKYFCIGDRVLYQKRYWLIDSIEPNSNYFGASPTPPSKHIDRWGNIKEEYKEELLGHDAIDSEDDITSLLEAAGNRHREKEEGLMKRAASHLIKMRLDSDDSSEEILYTTARTAGDVNEMLHTAAMTIHKAQGSEFKNVFLVLHHSHAVMATRELLYTGITRSRENLTVLYSGEVPTRIGASMMQKGIIKQKIPGKTVADKLKYFAGKREAEVIQTEIKRKNALSALGSY